MCYSFCWCQSRTPRNWWNRTPFLQTSSNVHFGLPTSLRFLPQDPTYDVWRYFGCDLVMVLKHHSKICDSSASLPLLDHLCSRCFFCWKCTSKKSTHLLLKLPFVFILQEPWLSVQEIWVPETLDQQPHGHFHSMWHQGQQVFSPQKIGENRNGWNLGPPKIICKIEKWKGQSWENHGKIIWTPWLWGSMMLIFRMLGIHARLGNGPRPSNWQSSYQ